MSITTERAIAGICASIWTETCQNKVAGLLEEAVEVAHASGTMTKDQTLTLLNRLVEHVYRKDGLGVDPSPPFRDPVKFFGELMDLQIMLSVVRQTGVAGYRQNESLLDASLGYMANEFLPKVDRQTLALKMELKNEVGIRFPD